jgi:hypothetical protein
LSNARSFQCWSARRHAFLHCATGDLATESLTLSKFSPDAAKVATNINRTNSASREFQHRVGHRTPAYCRGKARRTHTLLCKWEDEAGGRPIGYTTKQCKIAGLVLLADKAPPRPVTRKGVGTKDRLDSSEQCISKMREHDGVPGLFHAGRCLRTSSNENAIITRLLLGFAAATIRPLIFFNALPYVANAFRSDRPR